MTNRGAEPPPDQKRGEAERLREIVCKAPPLPDPAQLFPTEPPLTEGLAELAAWWIEARCGGCGHVAFTPLRMLAAERGWRTPLADVLPRLRCSRCHAAPKCVDLMASPAAGAVGNAGAPGKRLLLVHG